MKIYLASPLFTDYERKKVQRAASLLRNMRCEVYVPMEHSIENAWELPNYEWAKRYLTRTLKPFKKLMKSTAFTMGFTQTVAQLGNAVMPMLLGSLYI